MSCEDSWSRYAGALDALRAAVDELSGYSLRIGEQIPSDPGLLVSGELNSWRRYAQEAFQQAERLHEALEHYLSQVTVHDDVAEEVLPA